MTKFGSRAFALYPVATSEKDLSGSQGGNFGHDSHLLNSNRVSEKFQGFFWGTISPIESLKFRVISVAQWAYPWLKLNWIARVELEAFRRSPLGRGDQAQGD